MKLQLQRPLLFLDIETTSIDRETTRIIELAMLKLLPNGKTEARCMRFNPKVPITPESSAIHGIKDEDLTGCATFSTQAKEVLTFIADSDLAGYNSNFFDVPILYNEFLRAGIVFDYQARRLVDVGNIFKIKETRTLSAAMQFYCGKELVNAHSAMADTLATLEVFTKQLERYDDLPTDIESLALFSNYGKPILDLSGRFTTDETGNIIINFTQNLKGQRAKDNPSFLEWILRSGFPPDTQEVASAVLRTYYNEIGVNVDGDELPFDL